MFAGQKKFRYVFTDKRTRCAQSGVDSIRVEVSSWLAASETNDEHDLSSLQGRFPHIRDLFIKYNTILASSAPVERLFSFASKYFVFFLLYRLLCILITFFLNFIPEMIFRPQRQNLNDNRFEKLTVLKNRIK